MDSCIRGVRAFTRCETALRASIRFKGSLASRKFPRTLKYVEKEYNIQKIARMYINIFEETMRKNGKT